MDHAVIVDDEKGIATLGRHAKFCFCIKDGNIMPAEATGMTEFAVVFQFNKAMFPPGINFDKMFKANDVANARAVWQVDNATLILHYKLLKSDPVRDGKKFLINSGCKIAQILYRRMGIRL